jgi:hypothetical protein
VTRVGGPATGRVLRRFAAAFSVAVLLAGTTACTGDSDDRKGGPKPSQSQSPSPQPHSVRFRVSVTHVAGKLSKSKQATLARRVRRTLSAYVDSAFLGGDYPRSSFRSAFRSFTAGASHDARADQRLLTNRSLGASTASVRAVRRTAYLSVLAPKQHPAGVTAAVNLVFLVDRGDHQAQRVHLKGRLLLTYAKTGRWSIFGYDLNRSQTPARSGS